MRLLTNNKITEDNLTVNGVTLAFPKGNMINNTLIEKTYFEDYVDIDFGSAVTIDSVALIGADDGYILQGNSSASWTSPPYEEIITGVAFLNETYRYWRINKIIGLEPIDYTISGIDSDLTSPDGDKYTSLNTVPASGLGNVNLLLGDHAWLGGLADTTINWGGDSGGAYGQLLFNPGGTWDTFATSSFNGFKQFDLPKTVNGDILGGYFMYYYHNVYWSYALTGSEPVVIAQNGSVYKGSILNTNLIVRWDGKSGPAGSAIPDVIVDVPRPVVGVTGPGSSSINHFYLGEFLQMPGAEIGSIPQTPNNDIVNISSMGVIDSTEGVSFKEQEFTFPSTDQDDYTNFYDWWVSSDRINNFFFVQYEESMVLFPPYFARVLEAPKDKRLYYAYDWSIKLREAK